MPQISKKINRLNLRNLEGQTGRRLITDTQVEDYRKALEDTIAWNRKLRTCCRSSFLEEKGDQSRIIFKLLSQSSSEV